MQTGLQALTAYLRALLILINESELLHKLIFSDVIMTDQFDTQAPRPDELSTLKRQLALGWGEKWGVLQVALS